MKIIIKYILFFLLISLSNFGVLAADDSFSTKPTTNKGKKWRVAYYEGGPYVDYQQVLSETIRGLMKLGWIETAELPTQKGEENRILWDWLATKAKSDYIEFPKDAFYSANWESVQRVETTARLMQRFKKANDINLLIAMGTNAGQDFVNGYHQVPTILVSTNDPIAAGIIKSVEYSGFDHVHATVDPKRYERQVQIFHEIIGFKKLGMIYENSDSGKSYAAVDMIEKVSKERGFEIIRCYCQDESVDDQKIRDENVINCFKSLIGKIDALYVTQQGGVNNKTIQELVKIANAQHIPTFSQAGSLEVKYGILLSLSQANFKYVGEFHARTIAKIFNGAKPSQIEQLFEDPPKIAINLKTAEIIGFNPPIVMLGAADEIFNEIMLPK
jgi:ABC-type uncharacterized transport system substrate-binding protein